MKIYNETDLLNIDYRKKVLDEIEGNENLKRKAQMKRRYEIYKDNTKSYALKMMQDESTDKQIIKEIINRLSNISFCKKVIAKKSTLYKDGVKRDVIGGDRESQAQVDGIYDYVEINSVMKKTNRYTELFKNALVSVLPYECPKTGLYYYKPVVMAPFLYDAIEDYHNPEMPRAIITSYYNQSISGQTNYAPENMSGVRDQTSNSTAFREGDGKDQIIADAPIDDMVDQKEYVWWSNLYHFTTNRKGEIIPGRQAEDLLNPIQELPFVNFSQEQDGHFWAVGGEDLIDGSILLNILLSDLFYIAKYQGMGIGYMFGRGVPKNLKVGASSFVTLEMKEGDPNPQIGFVTSNPPIDAHLSMIESYVALLLSTNKLDTSAIAFKLTSGGTAASGIQEAIQRSENTDDIVEQQQLYRDKEPEIFELMAKWHNIYYDANLLIDDLQSLGSIPEDTEVRIKFIQPQPYSNEKDKLDIIEKRRDLYLDSMVDSVIRDNPELSELDAEAKILKTFEARLKEAVLKQKLTQGESLDQTFFNETLSPKEEPAQQQPQQPVMGDNANGESNVPS